VKVDRENAQRYVVIQSNVRDRDLVGFVEDAKAAVARDIKLPEGYRRGLGRPVREPAASGGPPDDRRAGRLAADLLPALLHLRLGAAALLVLSNIPFAMIGGVFGLLLAGEYLSVPASVGFIALLGIAVLNGVVMVTYFNQLLARGMPVAKWSSKGPNAACGRS
jgi:cobalt-zinc-cadmium resistance protein CzcA